MSVFLKNGDDDDDDFQPSKIPRVSVAAEEEGVQCPLCGLDISDLSPHHRNVHTNHCLDQPSPNDDAVVQWLSRLGLAKYAHLFIAHEIDWDSLHCLTDQDLLDIGVTALGPRKKIVHAISHLAPHPHPHSHPLKEVVLVSHSHSHSPQHQVHTTTTPASANKLITDYFPAPSKPHFPGPSKSTVTNKRRTIPPKLKDPPSWCCIPGTPFRVDAFRYLRGDCSHWFLTHFHMDHYQGLTKSFSRGNIYCSSITAKLLNFKIGIPWDRLHVLPLNQKITIAGVDVTSFDANHCPGALILLFDPPDAKAVVHTGDFRFNNEDKAMMSLLASRNIHTLILDTTYCNPQYDFPKQESVIQFVIDAIQAESFNPKTLFLIGSYTIGKERVFLEVARVLRKKIYVNSAKLRILSCLGLGEEDMQWFTQNEKESHIHVVPMWTIASFKRLKHVANHYKGRFSPIVAFTPTGWTFDKGKKSSSSSRGRKWRQGTIIRYEVPYSEHSSYSELKEFVKIVLPRNIIPSVNNHSPESAHSMLSLLLS